jgi:hypothetical protein
VKTLPALQSAVAEGLADGCITIRAIACSLNPDGIMRGRDIQTLTDNPRLCWLKEGQTNQP